MRRMSFVMTESQLLDGSKTVTRRLGWAELKPGARLLAVRKAMGLRLGEKQVVLGTITVVDVRRELLSEISDSDCAAEGFPGISPAEFVTMFAKSMGCPPRTIVTRIEFEFEPCEA